MSYEVPGYISVVHSKGKGKDGKRYVNLRPKQECFNRSRKVGGFNDKELWDKMEEVIIKWYAPAIVLYKIDGKIIGSNSEENALKEWWRVCEIEFIGVSFPVTVVNN